ncbi:unnamed protein product [Hydatigera taeniaeformis]|nr:unnamed protein product [Hydatigera taeniaeformis]
MEYKVVNTYGGVLSWSVSEKVAITSFGDREVREGGVAFHHDGEWHQQSALLAFGLTLLPPPPPLLLL